MLHDYRLQINGTRDMVPQQLLDQYGKQPTPQVLHFPDSHISLYKELVLNCLYIAEFKLLLK